MIDQIREEIIRISILDIILKIILNCKFGDKEEEEEITEEEVLEEAEAAVIEITGQRTHITIATICLVQPHGFQLNQFLQLLRILLLQTFLQDKLVVQLTNWQELLTPGHQIKLKLLNNNKNIQLILKPSISTSQSSETTSSYINPIPTPNEQQVQQEQDHLLHPPVAVSPPPINTSNIELPSVVDTQPNNMIQPVNSKLISQILAQNQKQLVNQQQQLFNWQNQQLTNQQYRLPDPPNFCSIITSQQVNMDFRAEQYAQRLRNEKILQENRERKEYRIHMSQRAQNKAQKYLMNGMLMNLEARSKDFENHVYHPLGNYQSCFNPNQYIDNLSQIHDDHESSDDAFGETDQIQLQVKGHRRRGKKSRGRCKAQSQIQPLLSSHKPIQESTQSKLKVPGQRRGKTGAADGTINPSAQSSRIKQIAGGNDFNFGSSMDIDMEQMMEMDLTQTYPTTNESPIVQTTSSQLGAASWHAGEENANVSAAQRTKTQHVNDKNEMNILQPGHFAAQGADDLGFQLLIGPEQEQSEDEPEQDQGQQDINNLPDNPGNEGSLGHIQETRRKEANKGSTKPRSKSSRKKKKSH
ncbi:MAG: hypothetical protein EZS28_024885 [Streblomastix strix]|uniref:Uncharacterized protein n=1 Tax=Streblomastix strix TaxID=222440 RepID=A0A5J4VAV2_9EUKA|nr:MAG: hypothetical protein EZS28_024885 [Streblomastix strix]